MSWRGATQPIRLRTSSCSSGFRLAVAATISSINSLSCMILLFDPISDFPFGAAYAEHRRIDHNVGDLMQCRASNPSYEYRGHSLIRGVKYTSKFQHAPLGA